MLEEIGGRLGLTRRIRQIQVEALRRLATFREIQAVPPHEALLLAQ
jgi:DNA-directed RNA polymerase sigma subunit (sigma70/sigma32)